MRSWNQWLVSTRLYMAFGLVALVVLSLLAVSYLQQQRSARTIREVTGIEYERMKQVGQWQLVATGTTVRIMALNRSQDPAIAQLFGPEIGGRIKQINDQRDAIRTWATSDEAKAWFVRLDANSTLILEALGKIAKARAAGDAAAANDAFEKGFMPHVNAYHDQIDEFAAMQQAKLSRRMEELQASGERQWWIAALALAALSLFCAGLVVALVRHIVRSLDRAVKVAETVASGDLTVQVQAGGRDEFATLMRALSGMAGSLQALVRQVRGGTEHIACASQQIAQGNNDLSERTEHQASNLQQTASTMEQLSAAVRQSAENAGQANQLAGQATEVAQRGGQAVDQVVQTMGQIDQASRRIEEIISVIDGISFQTNILALNAAVEAARAGEQGRGFAVVAGEVRQLAQRSATSAKEIKSLIADSAEKVRNGSLQAQAAGQTMVELMQSVRQVSTLIGEISSAAAEQHAGIAGVTHSVSQLDQSTQQNAALVEEAAATAGTLREQAEALAQAAAVFRVSVPA